MLCLRLRLLTRSRVNLLDVLKIAPCGVLHCSLWGGLVDLSNCASCVVAWWWSACLSLRLLTTSRVKFLGVRKIAPCRDLHCSLWGGLVGLSHCASCVVAWWWSACHFLRLLTTSRIVSLMYTRLLLAGTCIAHCGEDLGLSHCKTVQTSFCGKFTIGSWAS
jgi:hypothetical protein